MRAVSLPRPEGERVEYLYGGWGEEEYATGVNSIARRLLGLWLDFGSRKEMVNRPLIGEVELSYFP